ncbi:sensor histidine kinase [Ktedonobacteria bacterium brp13]|nr:sensor histidine kinase [Ktedonobacteria bacterium brp13]
MERSLIEELRGTFLFEECTPEQLQWLGEHADVVVFEAGTIVLRDDEPAANFWVLLSGQLQFTRKYNGRDIVTETSNQPGIWGGWLPSIGDLLVQSPYAIRTLERSRVLHLSKENVHSMLQLGLPVLGHLLAGIYGGVHNFETLFRQQDKMAALGKVSAGLAHELNNPAAAMRRGAEQLSVILSEQEERTLKLGRALDEQNRAQLLDFCHDMLQRVSQQPLLDPLTRNDQEDELQTWLDEHNVSESWNLAPTFVDGRITIQDLDDLASHLSSDALSLALNWLCARLSITEVTSSIETGSARISDLVKAIKDYTYMDQMPVQDVDVHEGLENTMRMLNYRLKKESISIDRQYDHALPKITAYGSQLNQVWTNLLDNAIDALSSLSEYARRIQIRTAREHDQILVVIQDNGPGVPPELQKQIFEPFFTTKKVGQGTGLGLDVCYRIVVQQHRGDLRFDSRPGETSFQVRLPITG